MWFLSGIGNVPTPNVRSDIWDRVESYVIRMLLACRLMITIPTSNLKLILSFLLLLILVLLFFKSLSVVASKQHAHLTSRTVLRLANRLSAQFQNSSKQGQPPSNGDLIYLFSSQGRVLFLQVSCRGTYLESRWRPFFLKLLAQRKNQENSYRRSTYKDQISIVPQQNSVCSSLKKLIVSTPLLLQGLHTMSLAKSVPDDLKPQECKRLCLREPPPIPYVPVKDEVQEEVSKMRNLQLKTSLEKDITLNLCDGGTGHHQEMWSLQGLQEGLEGLCGAQASGEVSTG